MRLLVIFCQWPGCHVSPLLVDIGILVQTEQHRARHGVISRAIEVPVEPSVECKAHVALGVLDLTKRRPTRSSLLSVAFGQTACGG